MDHHIPLIEYTYIWLYLLLTIYPENPPKDIPSSTAIIQLMLTCRTTGGSMGTMNLPKEEKEGMLEVRVMIINTFIVN